MFKSGEYTSQYVTNLDGSEVDSDRIQPVGVELTVDEIYKVAGYTILKDGEYSKGERIKVEQTHGDQYILKSDQRVGMQDIIDNVDPNEYNSGQMVYMDKPFFTLQPGPYVVRYNEKITVPKNTVGFVFPRSRLIRSNNFLSTAVWDSGYRGRGEGGLHVNTLSFIEKDMGIGVFTLAEANTEAQYNGLHQNENTE